jgi:hypothetical protein
MMADRAFRIVLQVDGNPWTCIRTFADDHDPADVTADEILPLLTPAVGETLATCSDAAREYLLADIVDEGTDLSSSITSVAEVS